MADGAPVSQEILLPTDTAGLTSAMAKLDAMIARVDKLEASTAKQERRSESAHASERKRHSESEHGWRGVGKSIEEAKRKSHEFFEFVGAVAAYEVLEKIADKFMEIGKEAVHAAAMAQRMNFAVDAAAGGKEQGENVREALEKNAPISEFSAEQNKAGYLRLKRAGIQDSETGRLMAASEDLAAVAAPDERQSTYDTALQAFARMHALGKTDLRTARMGFGLGVGDFATLPAFKGMSPKEISKAVETGQGTVSENDVLRLIMHRTGETKLGDRAVEASGKLLARWTKLTELPEQFFHKLGETAAADKLAAAIGGILEKLDPNGPSGKKIFGGLESTFTFIADKVGEIDFDAVASTITDDVLPAIKAMSGFIIDMIEPVERIIRGFHEMHDMLLHPAKNAALDEFERKQREAAAAEKRESEHPSFLDKKSNDLGGGFRAVGRDFSEGFATGIDVGSPFVEQKAGAMGETAVAAARTATDSHSPSRKAEEIGLDFGDGYALGLMGSAGTINDAMDSTIGGDAPSFGSIALPPGLARAPTVSVVVNVTAAPGQDADELGQTIAAAVRREVTGALDDRVDQGGTE